MPVRRQAKDDPVKRENLSILSDLEILRRALARLEEGFRLEKEDALTLGSAEALERLRERSRSHYQLEISIVRKDILRSESMLVPGEEWFEEGSAIARDLLRRAEHLLARVTGTPNRLLRNAALIAELAREGRPPAPPPRPVVEDEFEDLVRTDPPIECPVCGAWLMTDRGFTLLACPGCGAMETLELEPPEGDDPDGEAPDGGSPVEG